MKNLLKFERDLEALCRQHKVSMVIESYPEIGSGFTLETWDDGPCGPLLWADWAHHKRDPIQPELSVIIGGKE